MNMLTYSGIAVAKVDEDIYFSNYRCNGLYKYNMKNEKFEFVCFFSNVDSLQQGIHSKAIYENGTIYFLPFCSCVINCYEVQTGKEYSFVIDNNKKREAYCSNAYFENGKIHLFPCYSGDDYVEFDCEREKVIYNEEITKIIRENVKENAPLRMDRYRGKLYFCEVGGNKIYTYERGRLDVLSLQDNLYGFFVNDDECWITYKDSQDVVKYTNDYKRTVYKYENVESSECNSFPYSNMAFLEDDIFILNQYANHIMKINKEKKQIEIAFPGLVESSVKSDLLYGPFYSNYIVTEDEVIFFPVRANHIVIYNKKTKERVSIDTSTDECMIYSLTSEEKQNLLTKENGTIFSLNNFLKYMV